VSQRGSSLDDGCAPGAVVHVRTAVAGLLRLIEENTKTGSIHGMGGPREGWNRGEVMQYAQLRLASSCMN
jgi:hypothetical protein